MTSFEYPPLGRDWVTDFLGRHPHLKTVVGQIIESSRIQGTLPNVLKKWFDAFYEEVETDPVVLLENIYNMDESGFLLGQLRLDMLLSILVSVQNYRLNQVGRSG